MPSASEYIAKAKTPELADHLSKQWLDAVTNHTITCACGQLRALELAYRCLYCGQFLCSSCAEQHFGKTIAEHDHQI